MNTNPNSCFDEDVYQILSAYPISWVFKTVHIKSYEYDSWEFLNIFMGQKNFSPWGPWPSYEPSEFSREAAVLQSWLGGLVSKRLDLGFPMGKTIQRFWGTIDGNHHLFEYFHAVCTLWLWLTVRHGKFKMAHRNRWFTYWTWWIFPWLC